MYEVSNNNELIINNDITFIGNINPYRYKDYYYDYESKLYYLNSRYYSSDIRRFISPDDISYIDSNIINGLNLYCYCSNNPIIYSDPEGNFGITLGSLLLGIVISSMVIGAAVGGISTGASGGDFGDVFRSVWQGAVNGFLIGGSIDLIIAGFIAEGLGCGTIGGSEMISYGISTLSNYVEVGVLQYMKSKEEGKSMAERVSNVNRAIYSNRENILFGKTNSKVLDLDYAHGTRLLSKVYLMARYAAYYKNGVAYLTMKTSIFGAFLSYRDAFKSIRKGLLNILTHNYNSGWDFY